MIWIKLHLTIFTNKFTISPPPTHVLGIHSSASDYSHYTLEASRRFPLQTVFYNTF